MKTQTERPPVTPSLRDRRPRLLLLALAIGLTTAAVTPPAAWADRYAIRRVAEGLYRFSAGKFHAMFWVTPKSIVVVDTIDRRAAAWLKRALKKRFNRPVRYVIYSHNHYDHIYGGEVFDDRGTVFVAHRLARDDIVHTRARTRVPDLTFDDRLTITLGGESLRLRYHGPNNGRGSVSMLFEKQRVLFVVDWIVVGRMPWKALQGYDIEGMIRSTREALALPWDTFVGGHGAIGKRRDVKRYLRYLESLYAAVRDGMLAGKSLRTLQRTIRLDAFADLAQYKAWLPLNIAGVYRTLADQSYLRKRPAPPAKPAH
jgi:glyoxylase-like metal-dependent hydrolase (beta-lactamase superfamily II)